MSQYLDTAIIAAKKAGKVLMRYYNKKTVNYSQKKDNSFVSEADLAAEKVILDMILKKFPSHSFYSEETGKSKNSSEYCWYIDPLDGTHNFLHKIPLFAISIALAKDEKFIVGAVYIPYMDELYYAEKGKGAFMNGKKINVSKNILSKAACSLPGTVVYNKGIISKLSKIFENHCNDIRAIGSAAIGLAYISNGRFDFAIKPSITPYDTAAGKVVIEEAGGRVTDIHGNEFNTNSFSFIASNNLLHGKLIKIMKEEYL